MSADRSDIRRKTAKGNTEQVREDAEARVEEQETVQGNASDDAPPESDPESSAASESEAPETEEKQEEPTRRSRRAAKKEAAREAAAAKKEAASPEPRRSRLRWKKKELPGGLWLKCEGCGQTIYRKELEDKQKVCPSCNFHFTVPGKQRIEMLLDEGSFEEHFADLESMDRLGFTDKVPYSEKVKRAVERTGQKEALLCGLGSILGRPVAIAVLDFSFLGGSMGEVVGEKISLAAELAMIHDRPLILVTSSGGARMHEGMLSLLQMAKTSAALSQLNGRGGFSVCVMTHPTTGGVTASFASVCDITLAEPGALIGFAGPRVISTTIKQELPKGFQRAEFLMEKGQLDAIVQRQELPKTLAMLIDFARPPK